MVPISDEAGLGSDASWAVLQNCVGWRIVGIKRVFYDLQGAIETRTGAAQLEFDTGEVVFLDSGPDGESLVVVTTSWSDPFLKPEALTEENRLYVATAGKWTLFDVSRESGYCDVIDARILSVEPRWLDTGPLSGVVITTSAGILRIFAEWDELILILDTH